MQSSKLENSTRSMPEHHHGGHGKQQDENKNSSLLGGTGQGGTSQKNNKSYLGGGSQSGGDPNMTSYLNTSQDVGIRGFSLLSQRLRRQQGNAVANINALLNSAEPVQIRLFFQESCMRLTLRESEIRIEFADLYGVEVEAVQDHAILCIHMFATRITTCLENTII